MDTNVEVAAFPAGAVLEAEPESELESEPDLELSLVPVPVGEADAEVEVGRAMKCQILVAGIVNSKSTY